MKKMILSAILLVGAGVATTRAGVSFGISVDNDGRYSRGGYVASGCAPAPVYSQPGCEPQTGYFGDAHQALHQGLEAGRGDLHRDLRRERADMHADLRRERAAGVPHWVRAEQQRAVLRELREEHREGHRDLQNEHRQGHYGLGW
jgi:hypothetical protein